MIQISNSDYAKVVRFLAAFSASPATSKRDSENKRLALCLLRKWERMEKRRRIGVKAQDV